MPSKCFVPGCRTGYKATKKELGMFIPKVSLFRCPKDEIMLGKWRRLIRRADRNLESTDKVCEKHFFDYDIQRFYEEKFSDGTVFRLERGLATLRPGAIPAIFPGRPRPKPVIQRRERKRPALQITKVCTKKIKEIPADCDATSFLSQDLFSFEILKQEANLLARPDTLWVPNCLEKSIVWAKWTETFALERQLVITPNLHAKVLFKGKEIHLTSMVPLKSRACVEDLLSRVNALIICPGIERQSPGCLGYKENGLPDSLELHITVCKSCYNNKSLSCTIIRREVLISRYEKHTEQLQEARQKNQCLLRQVSRLTHKAKLLKMQYDLALKGP